MIVERIFGAHHVMKQNEQNTRNNSVEQHLFLLGSQLAYVNQDEHFCDSFFNILELERLLVGRGSKHCFGSDPKQESRNNDLHRPTTWIRVVDNVNAHVEKIRQKADCSATLNNEYEGGGIFTKLF
jgi:hypothetical protein